MTPPTSKAKKAITGHAGRPSLTGEGEITPKLTIRVTPATRDALEAIADAQGRRLTDVCRDALDEYVQGHRVRRRRRA